jgi:hypothetical protein
MPWPGALKVYLNGANQINMSKPDKRLPKNATKFVDHLSIISVGNSYSFKGFSIFSLSGP